MNSHNPSHRLHESSRAPARPAMVMPQLTHSEALAILRESGVPENEARRWVDRDAMLSSRGSSGG